MSNERILRPRAEKVFYAAGDVLTLKQDIPNKPDMVVQSVDKSTMKENGKNILLGVTCIWFSKDYVLQSHRFNSKDLKYAKDND